MEALADANARFWVRTTGSSCARNLWVWHSRCVQNWHRDVLKLLPVSAKILIFLVHSFIFFVQDTNGLGSMGTVAASYSRNGTTVCGIITSTDRQSIECWNSQSRSSFRVLPDVSFTGISGGNGVFCGLRQGGQQLICWNTDGGVLNMKPKRISKDIPLTQMAVGQTHICALTNTTNRSNDNVQCWRWRGYRNPGGRLIDITAGADFTCGIRESNSTVQCWGANAETLRNNASRQLMDSIYAGESHVCGIRTDGFVSCWGRNDSGQTAVPRHGAFEFESLALGSNHSCAIRSNGSIVCWGNQRDRYPGNISFSSIVAGDNFTCGVTTNNLSVLCWGGDRGFGSGLILQMPRVLPKPCDFAQCQCGQYPGSSLFCADSLHICRPCSRQRIPPSPSPSPSPSPTGLQPLVPITDPPQSVITRKIAKGTIALAVVGSVGTFIGILTILWWIYARFCRPARLSCRVHDSTEQAHSGPPMTRIQSARRVRRQRSGPSSCKSTISKRTERPEEFSFADLESATNGFSAECKIGSGSFGTVYKAVLSNGREVAIKRGEIRTGAKKYQENESAFESELAFLSRLHHKHLVALVGFCEEQDERLLVYEYMANGSLYDHLHKTQEINPSTPLNSWAMRIKIALDAARGIEYLHTYAVPPIIHRDIKSSNILLDGSWNARVSDFGLSLMGPLEEDSHLSLMAAGTVGYLDPEYYRLQHLSTKSDVYSFGVVLLEILTGLKAIHKQDGSGGPINVVDYALPHIAADDLPSILDSRLPPPRPIEIEAVTFVAYMGADCVSLEGKYRPSMTDIVANLEKALAVCVQSEIEAVISRSGSLQSRG
eukprot:Gb_25999 [translate_table: standard]